MNCLAHETQVRIVAALVEGNSVRSIERMTGVHRDTICRLLVTVGENCARLIDERMRKLNCQDLQADEIWTFVGKKQKKLTTREISDGERGDQYVFVAMDRETKLVPAFIIGKRDIKTAKLFLAQIRRCLAVHRPQLSTDGYEGYTDAVEEAFAHEIDYAQVVKHHSQSTPSIVRRIITGKPAEDRICTSHIERQNLTMRMCMRRFTRLTNGFSKRLRNLKAAVALHFAHYNFCRIHQTLRCTPAMAAGIEDSAWSVEELLQFAS